KFVCDSHMAVRDITEPPEIGNSYYTQWLVQEAAIDGSIDQILITDIGSGYTSPPSVTISAPTVAGGQQAVATAEITDGSVTRIRVTTPGSGYKYATVTLSGNATAKAMI